MTETNTGKKNCASFAPEEVSGNIYIRHVLLAKKGDFMDGHEHGYDHTSYIVFGEVHLHTKDTVSGEEHDYDLKAGDHFLIKKHVMHMFTATSLDGARIDCIYSHRDPQTDEVVQEANGNTNAYN